MRFLAVGCLSLVLAGCLDLTDLTGDHDSCDIKGRGSYTTAPREGELGLRLDPGQPWDGIALWDGLTPTFEQERQRPDGWKARQTNLTVPDPAGNGTAPRLVQFRLEPDASTPRGGPFTWRYGYVVESTNCRSSRSGQVTWELNPPAPGAVGTVAKGVQVYTAGFWLNGTLFYTNFEPFHSADWPRAGWYDYGGDRALPVYVYDKSRDERPAHWNVSTPTIPNRPVEPYSTTIEGFNEALKGLSVNTARVVVVPPEKAYTLPGREGHPLYGDTLVFWIQIVRVVDVPCTVEAEDDNCHVPGP